MKYASIDVGTNTALMLIVEAGGGEIRDILDVSSITRLGEGLKERGYLSSEAMDRTFRVLEGYRKIIDENHVQEVLCVGTSALREAANSEVFLRMVREDLQIPIRTISGGDEAFYTYLSVKHDRLFNGGSAIIVDIGGGSTEVIKGNDSQLLDALSLPVGTVKLTEMFIKHDPPLEEELSALADYVRGLFKFPFDGLGDIFIGTGGTITNLASIILGLEVFEADKIHALRVSMREIENAIDTMKGLHTSGRRAIRGMEQGREDLILQGIILLREIMLYFGMVEATVSTRGVRHGVLCDKIRLER
jgi:exopolyphosphatase / guanosine-5'-triphosphate,3'-diphosphate pyrophosphatase